MWAHYADHHRGVAIGFDASEFRALLYRVIYTTERAEYHPLFNAEPDDLYRRIIRTKSLDWAYEDEYRVIVAWAACDKRHTSGREMFFLPFAKDAVREIIIGCRASDDAKKEIMEIAESEYPRAELLEARRHPTDFRIEITSPTPGSPPTSARNSPATPSAAST